MISRFNVRSFLALALSWFRNAAWDKVAASGALMRRNWQKALVLIGLAVTETRARLGEGIVLVALVEPGEIVDEDVLSGGEVLDRPTPPQPATMTARAASTIAIRALLCVMAMPSPLSALAICHARQDDGQRGVVIPAHSRAISRPQAVRHSPPHARHTRSLSFGPT